MSTSYEEGARSFPHIPEDDVERDVSGSSGTKRYATRSSTSAQKQKVGQEHMFHQKVSGLGNRIKRTHMYVYMWQDMRKRITLCKVLSFAILHAIVIQQQRDP